MAYREGQLTKIQINGFKSIRECSIDLKPINVLIGSNGAGKSNFISAFTLLQNILHIAVQHITYFQNDIRSNIFTLTQFGKGGRTHTRDFPKI